MVRVSGLYDEFPSTGVLFVVAGDGPSLITSWGRGNCGTEEWHADADSVSAQVRSACRVVGWNELPPSVPPGIALVQGAEEESLLVGAASVSARVWLVLADV